MRVQVLLPVFAAVQGTTTAVIAPSSSPLSPVPEREIVDTLLQNDGVFLTPKGKIALAQI
jgi:hypothetical protein